MLLRSGMLVEQYGDHMDGWGGGWMWLWGTLMMLAFVAALGVAAWAVVRSTQARRPAAEDRAREILAERYARGELSTEEYTERLEALRTRQTER
jgi:putative membrane protein